ncbi:ABC-three component system middle component 5 [Tahibacter aquaticus]|nr:ABC-three component system middle component 5 [Tahibacter aquaticus]
MTAIVERIALLEFDKARLIDFYLVFPASLQSIRFTRGLSKFRRYAKDRSNIYRDPSNPLEAFRALRPMQEAAVRCLASAGIIDSALLGKGLISRRAATSVWPKLAASIAAFTEDLGPLSEAIIGLGELQLAELKERSGLMEHRYGHL